ncbi:hypothetical protein F5Y09DRAFT_313319 [Xylaria sp. FL1042]|nr:hypothetical protein F5Y09DRAFT_313319 [Xylaria sp. FL1042]
MARKPNKDTLIRAIDNADVTILRGILKSMCDGSEVCRKEAMDRMLVSRKHEIIELSDSSEDEGEKRQNKRHNKKQKRVSVVQKSRFEVCETCDKTYDVTLNHDEACQTHEDLLELDSDYFPDDDQIRYDRSSVNVETDWRRETCPEGFVWQCCGEPLNGEFGSEFCLIQRHIPKKP